MRVALRPRSGCLLLCLGVSVLTMLLQNLWVPLDITRDEPTGRQNHQGLAQLVEKELRRVSQQLDKLIRLHQPHRPSPGGGLDLHTGEAPFSG
ncbi:unnamed protein product [Tetraodon nigroviridis]|uniref:(spotted green pufferfish) hypothetical protein n=1 Tax=Tetraodon nigroviridis TaxID=99883 RepID=Q4S4U8_TETNG|nr:unnamed protein product [Tetraodon nigroviridis]